MQSNVFHRMYSIGLNRSYSKNGLALRVYDNQEALGVRGF